MNKAMNVIISCIDFRIQETFYNWLEKTHNLGRSDIIEVAGSSKDLIKPLKKEDREELIRNIDISIKLHDPKVIMIIDHQDCGGYAQDNTIQQGLPVDEDIKLHKIYLHKTAQQLQELYPDKVVKTLYISLNGDISEI